MSNPGPQPAPPEPKLAGYETLVCVTGGIAAYKVCTLVSRLAQAGCGVTVAMSRSARRFVGPTTFQALSGRPVLLSQWHGAHAGAMEHLAPTEAADLVVVAPATANCIGKLASGIADDLISTLLLGAACPVMLAPAMNTRMWQNPAVQRNIAFLRENGVQMVGPESGWLACREVGAGRMSEPEALLEAVTQHLQKAPPRSRWP